MKGGGREKLDGSKICFPRGESEKIASCQQDHASILSQKEKLQLFRFHFQGYFSPDFQKLTTKQEAFLESIERKTQPTKLQSNLVLRSTGLSQTPQCAKKRKTFWTFWAINILFLSKCCLQCQCTQFSTFFTAQIFFKEFMSVHFALC